MKYIYITITILLVSAFSCKAQLNELTETEFYEIEINNISLRSIFDTNADLTQMRALFGSDLLYEFENDILITKEFWKPNLYYFSFDSDIGSIYNLSYFKIRNFSINIKVKGITVRLGDDKSLFGNDIVINTNNGDNSIVFIDQLTGSAALAFKIDKTTNKITEIEFNVYD